MAKLKEYYQVGNREEMTQESLLVLMEDMYKDLALAINSNTSSCDGKINAFGLVNGVSGAFISGDNLTSTKLSQGVFKLSFTTPMSDINYAIVCTPQLADTISVYSVTVGIKTVNDFIIKIKAMHNVFVNTHTFSVIVVN